MIKNLNSYIAITCDIRTRSLLRTVSKGGRRGGRDPCRGTA